MPPTLQRVPLMTRPACGSSFAFRRGIADSLRPRFRRLPFQLCSFQPLNIFPPVHRLILPTVETLRHETSSTNNVRSKTKPMPAAESPCSGALRPSRPMRRERKRSPSQCLNVCYLGLTPPTDPAESFRKFSSRAKKIDQSKKSLSLRRNGKCHCED